MTGFAATSRCKEIPKTGGILWKKRKPCWREESPTRPCLFAPSLSLLISLSRCSLSTPETPLSDGEAIRLKLVVHARHGADYDRLVRVLISVCGLHVDMTVQGADGSATLTVEGETTGEDIALAVRKLLPEFEEMIDLMPAWSNGMLGLMQLIVLLHTEQSLRKRLL